ncbi:3-deoxy-D-manno-octulosonic acid transferase [Gammaproteobacteria bacterium]|nr:3-deoxy-D-manno-octulosonic acid transferase [Gammaproteobacteria bacterium]
MFLFIYQICFFCLIPIFFLNLLIKGAKQKLYLSKISNRIGLGFKKRNDPILIHAVSLGEVLGIKNFVKTLEGNNEIIISVSTATGLQKAQELYGHEHQIIFLPWDFFIFINLFFRFLDVKLILLFETEIWPYLIYKANKLDIPVILLNGRLSKRSASLYKQTRLLMTPIFKKIDKLFVQSDKHLERFCNLGVDTKKIEVVGSVKYDIEPAKETPLEKKLPNKFILAASTHKGEEEIVLNAYKIFKQDNPSHPNVKLVICPRHPERANSVKSLCDEMGLNGKKFSCMEVDSQPEVIIIDTIGLLNTCYMLSSCAFVGGSLVYHGGHNLAEPACNKTPIIIGPYTFNFEEMSSEFISTDSAVVVHNQSELGNAFNKLINDVNYSSSLIANAVEVFNKNKGSTQRQGSYIMKLLESK